MDDGVRGLIDAGQRAVRCGDALTARQTFTEADETAPCGATAEGLGRAAYLDHAFREAVTHWERAYASYRREGDGVAAVRLARILAYQYGAVLGDWAVSSGWLARAQTLLAASDPAHDPAARAEAGWVDLCRGMFEPDRARKDDRFRAALAAARDVDDRDLELMALAYLGASLVHGDRTEEGMLLLDEALAALAGDEVEDFSVLEETFCQLFSACERASDVDRADQWMRVGDALAQRRRLPAVSAFCRTHYGGVLTAAGRWPEAEVALTEAVELWALGERSGLRRGALARLADLRVRQGRYEEAEQLLTGLEGDDDAVRPLAALHLARGEAALACDHLERALERAEESASAAPLLALHTASCLAAGRLKQAAASAARLERCAQEQGSHYLRATAALARGRVALVSGEGDPVSCLREALAGFARAQMPMELAHTRLALAHALVEERPEVALSEARAALQAFEQLQAARDVDAAASLLRALGGRPAAGSRSPGVLTQREAEVLSLVGLGLSNPEIAERLYISRKTVEHHVGNVLAKLGLRSRAEAAAHAARSGPGPE